MAGEGDKDAGMFQFGWAAGGSPRILSRLLMRHWISSLTTLLVRL